MVTRSGEWHVFMISATSLYIAQMRRAVCQRQMTLLFSLSPCEQYGVNAKQQRDVIVAHQAVPA